MAGSINKVILVGNLGRDPEIRATQDGRELVSMALATSDTWRDKQTGERRERTEWHRVVIFNEGLVNVAKNYLRKGSKVYIEGALQTRKWTDQQGQERYSTEVVLQGYQGNLTMLDTRREGQPPPADATSSGTGYYGGAPSASSASERHQAPAPELDDDVPF